MRKTIAETMKEVLEETDNPAVMWGDAELFEMCAEKLGRKAARPSNVGIAHSRMLDACQQSPLFDTHYIPVNLGRNSFHSIRRCCLKDEDPKTKEAAVD